MSGVCSDSNFVVMEKQCQRKVGSLHTCGRVLPRQSRWTHSEAQRQRGTFSGSCMIRRAFSIISATSAAACCSCSVGTCATCTEPITAGCCRVPRTEDHHRFRQQGLHVQPRAPEVQVPRNRSASVGRAANKEAAAPWCPPRSIQSRARTVEQADGADESDRAHRQQGPRALRPNDRSLLDSLHHTRCGVLQAEPWGKAASARRVASGQAKFHDDGRPSLQSPVRLPADFISALRKL